MYGGQIFGSKRRGRHKQDHCKMLSVFEIPPTRNLEIGFSIYLPYATHIEYRTALIIQAVKAAYICKRKVVFRA